MQAFGLTKTVRHLDLSSNRLDKTATPAIRDMLRLAHKLETLNLSCNSLGPEGGKVVYEGVRLSRSVKKVDVRLTGCGKDADAKIQQALKKNKADGELVF